MSEKEVFELCDRIREHAFKIHKYHRHGHIETIYKNAIAHRLKKDGLNVVQWHPLNVLDEDGHALGTFYADLFVDEELIVNVKAYTILTEQHTAELLGHLRSARVKHGVLLNFGSQRLQIRKYTMTVV